MKSSIRPLSAVLAQMGIAASLHADVMLSNLGDPSEFRSYGAGLSAGTTFTTGPGRVTVDSVTLEQLLYDPANPPQHFQVLVYKAVYPPGSSSPNMTLVGQLGNPAVAPTATALPGLTSFVVYSPLAAITLEASTTYAVTVGEALDGSSETTVLFTEAPGYDAAPGWSLGGDLAGFDFGGFEFWAPSTGQLKFMLDASPALNAPPDISNAQASVPVLWPPDGRMVPFQIVGVTDPDGDPVSISITGIQQDEPPGIAGQGPDALVDGSGTAAVRAARMGKGNGRVYKIFFTASDGKPDGSVDGVVFIGVPHDQAHPVAIDDGPVTGYFNSVSP